MLILTAAQFLQLKRFVFKLLHIDIIHIVTE